MLYLGYKMNAQEAKKYGLVSKVYNHDFLEEVWDYLNNISKLSSEVLFLLIMLFAKLFMLQNHNNETNRIYIY